jgi:membrane fusion protein, multidrug efflux system
MWTCPSAIGRVRVNDQRTDTAQRPREEERPGVRRDGRDSSREEPHPSGDRKPALTERRGVRIAAALVLGLLVVLGVLFWLYERRYESTDDAFIDAHIVRVAPRVAGQVTAVLVNDNQHVTAGQLLVQIDVAPARARVDQLNAQQAQARTAITGAEAQIRASEAQYQQSLANLESARAQTAKALSDLRRYRALKATTPQAVSQEQLDDATAAARSAVAQQSAARQQTHTAAAQIETARAQLASSQATLRSAAASLHSSQLDYDYTSVYAPVSGHIAQRSVAVGDYVSAGTQLMAIVPLDLWVTANFKETALTDIRPNQPVQVHVDACPQADIRGHVDSIQRGAGQAFALLPPENATGNFVKVVQRVPVKILLDRIPKDCVLGPGMSVEPRVSVR